MHVSGHASRDELIELIKLVRPTHFVPIHGEYRHLKHHHALAIEAGVPQANCFLLEDGDSLVMENGELRRGRTVTAGTDRGRRRGIWADPGLLRERRALAHDGTVVAIVAISARNGKIVAGPDLLSRGVVSGNGTSPHIARARTELAMRIKSLSGAVRDDPERLKEEMVRMLRRYFGDTINKRPIIVPYVMEV